MQQWIWVEIIEDNLLEQDAIEVEFEVVTEPFNNGDEPMQLEVVKG
jgi:hypothetical protein